MELEEILEIEKKELNKKENGIEEKKYNMYCPYAAECEKEERTCEGGKCKEYQWGK